MSSRLEKLRELVAFTTSHNPFYQKKLKGISWDNPSWEIEEFFAKVPFTTKEDLVRDHEAHPPYGSHLSSPVEEYVRLHQTSGSTGTPLVWLDTSDSWNWVISNWKTVLKHAGVGSGDVVYVAFGFGHFLGFWAGFEAACESGCLSLSGGGMQSLDRLHMMIKHRATVLCCTPTYALRLIEVAKEKGIDLNTGALKRIVLAGEPGGSLEAVRKRIESGWPGAKCFDHHGMTEIGPVSYQSPKVSGTLQIIEESYLAEVLDENDQPVKPGENGELVLTTLGRSANPLIRYRTGDIVCPLDRNQDRYGTPDLPLKGGIIGRVDDMLLIKGVNVYPSVIDKIIFSHVEVIEYQAHIIRERGVTDLALNVETHTEANSQSLCKNIRDEIKSQLAISVNVAAADTGSLPRYELKAKRWNNTKA